MSVRCFIAIEMPTALKDAMAERTENVRRSGADARWVKAENLHLTLKFLGSVSEETIEPIKSALLEAVKRHSGFRLRFRGAGVFPDRKRPRVVWIGAEDSGELVSIQKDVEEAMSALGFEAEKRPYSPHLTIGRLKSPRRREILIRELDAISTVDFGSMDVAEVALMRSTIKPGGAEYSRLFGAPLATS